MHNAFSTCLKRTMAVALVAGPMLALVSVDVEARRGGGGGGFGGGGHRDVRAPRANVGGGGNWGGGGRDFNRRDVNVNRRDVNYNRRDVNYNRRDVNYNRRDVNYNRNVHVDVDNHWGYGGVGAGAAVAVGTAIAVGAIVSTLPPSCNTFVADGVTYRNCGGTYYAPRYDGPNVVYEVVSPPSSGWSNQ